MARVIVNPYRVPVSIWQDPFFNQALKWASNGTNGNGNNTATLRANVYQDDNNFYVYAFALNADANKFDISVLENKLTIVGETVENNFAPEGEGITTLHRELAATKPAKFERSFTLPAAFSADEVAATFENGVLKLTLPKIPAVKPRRIAVTQPSTLEA
jgi:HSP20 family protein